MYLVGASSVLVASNISVGASDIILVGASGV